MKTCSHCATPLPGWIAARTQADFGAPLCLGCMPDCDGRLADVPAFLAARRAVRRLARLEYGATHSLRIVEGDRP